MTRKQAEEKLLLLLEQKDFDQLNLIEKKFVLDEMGIEEYKETRKILMKGSLVLQSKSTEINPSIKANLDIAFRKKYQPATDLSNILQSKIQFWKAAAAFVFLLMSFVLFIQNKNFSTSSESLVIYKIDTVFKDFPQSNLLALNDSASQYPDTPVSYSGFVPGEFAGIDAIDFKQEDLRYVNSGGFPANTPQSNIFKEKNIPKPDWNEILQNMPIYNSLENGGNRQIKIY